MDSLIEITVAPVSDTQPAGINIRYDDEFEFIEHELAKQGSLTDRGQILWDKVADSALNLLTNKSKDLKVSCYLIRALYEQSGFKGLATGLIINQKLLNSFWDDLFPLKDRARANAYEWLVDRFEGLFQDIEPQHEQQCYIEQSYETLQTIENFLNDKLSQKSPSLGHLRRSLADLLQSLKEHNNEQSVDTYQNAASSSDKQDDIINDQNLSQSQSVPHNNTANEIIQDSKTEQIMADQKKSVGRRLSSDSTIKHIDTFDAKTRKKVLRQCHEAMRNLSKWSLNEELDSPSAYAMNRFSTWMTITQIPIHNNHVTPLKPLPKDKLDCYKSLYSQGKYHELIPQIELSFSKSPFWLDAHRMVAHGLESLNMHDCATTVKDYLTMFVKRFPAIIDLKFSDNTGFADPQTRNWINSDLLLVSVSENKQPDCVVDDIDYKDILIEAGKLSRTNKIREALELFNAHIAATANFRHRIYLKYNLARFCHDNGLENLAVSLLLEIDEVVSKYGLESWEPEFVKNVVYLLILCLKQVQASLSDDIKVNDTVKRVWFINNTDEKQPYNHINFDKNRISTLNQLYSRLCRLDPALAFDIA